MLDHRARGDFAQLLAFQVKAVDQRRKRRGQHVEVAVRDVGTVAACERNAHTTEDGDRTGRRGHRRFLPV